MILISERNLQLAFIERRITMQDVIFRTAIQKVRPSTTIELILPLAAYQNIITMMLPCKIFSARIAPQLVATRAPENNIIPPFRFDPIVAITGINPVRPFISVIRCAQSATRKTIVVL